MPEYTYIQAADELPPLKQEMPLVCRTCGKEGVYDVGRIYCDLNERTPSEQACQFTHYFRCAHCGSAGPFAVMDYTTLLYSVARSLLGQADSGFVAGRCALFDGTSLQTVAMGEEYLLKLIEQNPGDVFLHSRLGNLLRASGAKEQAAEWYERAVLIDAGDIESRYHLFAFAAEAKDFSAAFQHASLLVRYLMEGRSAVRPDLTAGIAYHTVLNLRKFPAEVRERLLNSRRTEPARREDAFIQSLLREQGNDDEIVETAYMRLLGDEALELVEELDGGSSGGDFESVSADINPNASLQGLIESQGLSVENLEVGFETDGRRKTHVGDRHEIRLFDGKKTAVWQVPSLRELFRGDRVPPSLERYPEEYVPYFYFVERQLLAFSEAGSEPTDQQWEEVFSNLRRRPDGRSLGAVHDFVWQVAALLMGMYELSGAEFEAIFGRLTHSAQTWGMRPVSRNYFAYLKQELERDF